MRGRIEKIARALRFRPSWWPMFCAMALATVALGVIIGWWLFIIGAGIGAVTLCGWIFEYYRGIHAH